MDPNIGRAAADNLKKRGVRQGSRQWTNEYRREVAALRAAAKAAPPITIPAAVARPAIAHESSIGSNTTPKPALSKAVSTTFTEPTKGTSPTAIQRDATYLMRDILELAIGAGDANARRELEGFARASGVYEKLGFAKFFESVDSRVETTDLHRNAVRIINGLADAAGIKRPTLVHFGLHPPGTEIKSDVSATKCRTCNQLLVYLRRPGSHKGSQTNLDAARMIVTEQTIAEDQAQMSWTEEGAIAARSLLRTHLLETFHLAPRAAR